MASPGFRSSSAGDASDAGRDQDALARIDDALLALRLYHRIAEHLPVTLCGRYAGNEPFAPGSGWDRLFTPLLVFVANHVLSR